MAWRLRIKLESDQDFRDLPGVVDVTFSVVRPPGEDGELGQARWTLENFVVTRRPARVVNGRVVFDSEGPALAALEDRMAYFAAELLNYHEADQTNPVRQIRWTHGYIAWVEYETSNRGVLLEKLGIEVTDLEIDGNVLPIAVPVEDEAEAGA